MANKHEGGIKTRDQLLAKDPDFYKKIGRKGGKASRGGGFTGDSKRAKAANALSHESYRQKRAAREKFTFGLHNPDTIA